MIVWLIAVTYVAGWLFYGVFRARRVHSADVQLAVDEARRWGRPDAHGLANANAGRGALLAAELSIATLWPLLAPFDLLRELSRGRIMNWIMRTDLERQLARDAELDALRAQAKELGLPYPGGDR